MFRQDFNIVFGWGVGAVVLGCIFAFTEHTYWMALVGLAPMLGTIAALMVQRKLENPYMPLFERVARGVMIVAVAMLLVITKGTPLGEWLMIAAACGWVASLAVWQPSVILEAPAEDRAMRTAAVVAKVAAEDQKEVREAEQKLQEAKKRVAERAANRAKIAAMASKPKAKKPAEVEPEMDADIEAALAEVEEPAAEPAGTKRKSPVVREAVSA